MLKIDGKSHYKNYDNNTFTHDTMEAKATSQSAKGGPKAPKFMTEQREAHQKKWESFLKGQVPDGITQEQINQILFCLSLGRYDPHVLQMMTQFGLPHPERGSLSLDFFETLRSTSIGLFNERVNVFSLEETKYFLSQLDSRFTNLGDVNQVSGNFPNKLGSPEKFHTPYSQDAKELLLKLLERVKFFGATVTEIITHKIDGSCTQLHEKKLVFSGSRHIENKLETEKKILSLKNLIEKKSKSISIFNMMPEEKKRQKQEDIEKLKNELEMLNIQLAFFMKTLQDIADVEAKGGDEGSTYELTRLGDDSNDIASVMFPIMGGKTIVSHDELGIPEIKLPSQHSSFFEMDNASILESIRCVLQTKVETTINASRSGRPPFVFRPVPILKGAGMSSICEGGVLQIRIVFKDGTVFRMFFKIKFPAMNEEKRDYCVYSDTFTKADHYALLKEWLISLGFLRVNHDGTIVLVEDPAVEKAVLASAGGGQAGEP